MSVVVCDASVLVAALVDSGRDGAWAATSLTGAHLVAPDLLPYETSHVLRRLELSGVVGSDLAAQAHADLLDLAVELWPYELLARRVWELRLGVSSYDGAHVALAERLEAPLVTLDRRVAAAPGLRCSVITP